MKNIRKKTDKMKEEYYGRKRVGRYADDEQEDQEQEDKAEVKQTTSPRDGTEAAFRNLQAHILDKAFIRRNSGHFKGR